MTVVAIARGRHTIVTIPVRDEANRIGACLNALNEQTRRPDAVVLLLNNCSDQSHRVAVAMAPDLRFQLRVVSVMLPPDQANAGHARRLAMQLAAQQAPPDAVLLTTDADAVVPSDWIAANLAALHEGAEVVCGRAVIDPLEAKRIPGHLHADDARECRLISLLDEFAWMLDPEMHDPPPRHAEASGASLAVTVEMFHRAGGIPAIASGEDRAFVRTLWMMDARVRHDPAIEVVVSGRVNGRAPGGMADTIRRRMVRQDEFTDELAEPAIDAFLRYSLRQRARRAWSGLADPELGADLGLSHEILTKALGDRFFGSAWAALEANSWILQRRPIRFVDLTREIVAAQLLLSRLVLPEALAAD